MIKWKQAGQELPDYGLDFGNPDFVKYAESYGAKGHRINKTEELEKVLNSCYEQKGVHIVDVPVDYSQNTKTLLDELKQFE